MALNQKAIKVLGKVFEAGFTDEKSIAAMTMDDILAIQGITIGSVNKIRTTIFRRSFLTTLNSSAKKARSSWTI